MDALKKATKKEAKRQNILNGALRAFCEKGIDGTTIDDICKKVNCSHGLFYHYYENKDELIKDLKNTYDMSYYNHYYDVLTSTTCPYQRLKEVVSYTLHCLKNDEGFVYRFYFIMTEIFRKNENSKLFVSKDTQDNVIDVKKVIQLFKDMFNSGVEKNIFKTEYSPSEYLSILASIIIGTAMQLLLLPKQFKAIAPTPNVDVIMSLVVKEDFNIETR